jgi:hypothetical protein
MHTISRTAVAMGFAVMCTTGLAAQTQDTKTTTTTKIEIKDGKEITAIGCLTRTPDGDFILTKFSENRLVNPAQYALVSSDDLSKQVGHLVEIQGKTVTAARGKVSIESKTKTEVENGKDRELTTKSQGTTGAFDMPFLGVSSTKMLSASCN